jgi:hypothetical protein
VIFNQIDTSYYGDNDDENGIMDKVKWPMEEEMQARASREWKMIESI